MDMRSTKMHAYRKNMKIEYKYRAYFYIIGLLVVYFVLFIMLSRNKQSKLQADFVESNQLIYTKIVDDYFHKYNLADDLTKISEILLVLPQEIHLSVFNDNGETIYDNKLPKSRWDESKEKKNVEIPRALLKGKGYSVRKGIDADLDYAYYALFDGDYVIRTGMPYNPGAISKRSDAPYFLLVGLLFLIVAALFSLIYFGSRDSINKLRQFVTSFRENKRTPNYVNLVDNDLNELQLMIADVYRQLASEEKNTQIEREKLLQHFHFSEEGISFFTEEYENLFTNVYFIQYLNILFSEPTFDVNSIFTNPIFNDVVRFLENPRGKKNFTSKLYGNGKSFGVRVIIFPDRSFEIIIRKVTEAEMNEMDAAAMTNSIAHELKTPLTSMRGYLETLIAYDGLNLEKQKNFMERTYKQCLRLDEIIQDMVLLSKTIYSPQYFLKDNINLYQLINEIVDEDRERFENQNYTIEMNLNEDTSLKGNRTLLTSIFRNLISNAVKYAGDNVVISINNYLEDDNYYYFSVADNGVGVEEKHLENIFNRFYRVADGRTRDKGGSGLGLSIVKDAVHFHQGEIYAKNRVTGGLEFLFTLRKTDAV